MQPPTLTRLLCFVLLTAPPAFVMAQSDEPGIEPAVELVVASDVVDRQPVDSRTSFPPDTEFVVAWARLSGLGGTTVTFVWEHGENLDTINAEIGSSSWRTWSRKSIPEGSAGEWSVRVTGPHGILARETFTIEAAP